MLEQRETEVQNERLPTQHRERLGGGEPEHSGVTMAALMRNTHTIGDAEVAQSQIGQRMRFRTKNPAATPAQHGRHRDGRPPIDGSRDHISVEVLGYDESAGRSILRRLDGGRPETMRVRLANEGNAEHEAVQVERAAVHHRTRQSDGDFVRYGMDGKGNRAVDPLAEGKRTRVWGDRASGLQARRRHEIVNQYNKREIADGSQKTHHRTLSAKEKDAMQRRQRRGFDDIWEVHDSLPTKQAGSRDAPRDDEEALARAVYVCAVGGKAEAIQEILSKAERNANAPSRPVATRPLPRAARKAKSSGLTEGQALVRRLVNSCDQGNDTPLHAAVRSGSHATVKLLLGFGADKYRRNDNGMTPTEVATKAGNMASIGTSEIATQSGTNPDIVHTLISDDDLGVVLYKAAEHGNVLEVQGLLKKGVFVDCTPHITGHGNRSDWTPLHAAAHAGQEKVVDILCAAGADIHRKTREGKTAEALVMGRRTDFGVEMNKSAGADVHLRCAQRLRRAAEEEPSVVARKLRDACYDGDAAAAAAALQLEADVNGVLDSSSGMTPLHWAVKRDNLEVVEVLMSHVDAHDEPHPADIQAKDAKGLTPLDYLKQNAAPDAFVLTGHDSEANPHVRLMGTYREIGGGRVHNGSPVYRKEGAFVTTRVKSLVGSTEQTRTKKLGSGKYYAYRGKSGKWIITDDERNMKVNRGLLVSSAPLLLPTDAMDDESDVVFEEWMRGGSSRPVGPSIRVMEAQLEALRGEQDRPKGLGMGAENKIQKRRSKRAAIAALLEAEDDKLRRLEAMKAAGGEA